MEKILHFTVPAKLTPVNVKMIALARELHPTWEVKVWQDPMQPDGYPLERYWSKANSGAQLSDLLRLDVLYKWGGVYLDADMRLLKPLDELASHFEFFFASHEGTAPINAIIGARKGHPAIRAVIDELLLNEPDWTQPPDVTTGPDIFVRTLRWDKTATALPREIFFGYGPLATQQRKNHRQAFGEHLWEFSWRDRTGGEWRYKFNLKSETKGLLKAAATKALRLWHRLEGFDRKQFEKPEEIAPRSYPVADEIVLKSAHSFSMIVDGKDARRSPSIIFGDYYEPREDAFIRRHLSGGDWAISVDTSGGWFGMLAAQCVRTFGRVFVYEPDGTNLQRIARSVVMNRMHDRIILRSALAGDIAGTSTSALAPASKASVDAEAIAAKAMLDGAHVAAEPDNAAAPDVSCVTLDQEFPVDLPIKLLKIDADGREVAILKGAQRLTERRCVDFILIKVLRDIMKHRWRRELGGERWHELLAQFAKLMASGYAVCTVAKDGSLVEHRSAAAALDRAEGRQLVFMAKDQYTVGYQDIGSDSDGTTAMAPRG
jgi:FkbM family methyltransferase